MTEKECHVYEGQDRDCPDWGRRRDAERARRACAACRRRAVVRDRALAGGAGPSCRRGDRRAARGRPDREEIVGPGGVLAQLTKRLVERAMSAELTEHLGYEPHQEPPGGSGNTR